MNIKNCITLIIASTTLLINAEAQPLIADAGNDTTIICGEAGQLNGGQIDGSPPFSYSWSPSTGLSNSSIANPVASPTSTTLYFLTVTDSLIAQDTDSVMVTVANIVAVCPPDTTIFLGNFVQLNVLGGSFYLWSPASFLSNGTIANPVATPTSTITYTVTTWASSCNSDTCSVTVNVLVNSLNDKENALSNMQISPNPFNSSTTITLSGVIPSANEESIQFQLYDVLGREVDASTMLSIINDGVELVVEKGNLPEGLYFFKVFLSEEVIRTGKLLMQN